MTESNLVHCKHCKKLKERIEDGKFNKTNKRFKDINGKLWNGKTCPDCHAEKIKMSMKKLRFLRTVKGLNDEDSEV